jgi:phenylacetate-CoA ligase
MLRNAYNTNSFYKKLYDSHGIDIHSIKSIDDINKLPVLKKSDVRENTNSIKQTKGFLINKGHTSGTTGSPLVVYRDYDSILNEHAYIWWYRMKSGLNPKDKKISIRGDLNRDTLHYFDRASNTLFISSFALNHSNIIKLIPIIREFSPKAALGYPSSLYTIASWLEENNEELNIPLSFTSSESLLAFQEDIIKKTFNTNIFDWYGNAERTIALYREGTKYFEPLLYSINEYQTDRVISTSLINNYFPLIRYEVNDVLDNTGKYDFEKKSTIINGIYGRIEDYILLPDGTKIGRLDVVFKGINNISMAQIIQKEVCSIQIKVVPFSNYSDNDEKKLRKNLTNKLGEKLEIKISVVQEDEIEYTKSKKYKLVLSKLNK